MIVALPVLLMTGPGLSAQTADRAQASDSSKAVAGKSSSLYAGGGYGSNMIYLGSTMSQDNPYGYASVSYGFHNKLFATVSAVHLSAADPLAAFYIGSLSYSHPFNDWFDISAGIYRYQVDPSLTDTLFGSFNYGDLTRLRLEHPVYKNLGGSPFSEESHASPWSGTQGISRLLSSSGKASISFDHNVHLMFGTHT